MKKLLYLSLALALSACSDSNKNPNPDPDPDPTVTPEINITEANRANWTTYARNVANLLATDATSLRDAWETSYEGGPSYASIFKQHKSHGYTSASTCIEEIIEGCADIANEVGESKMGDPYDLLAQGKTEQALFAVESWYSWHSREDYSNNIISIRNSYLGTLDGTLAPASISALTASIDPDLDAKVKRQIQTAYTAILAIPAPFRNNISSAETTAAMTACATLDATLTNELKPLLTNLSGREAEEQAIVDNYVDAIVLPTYRSLAELAGKLKGDIDTLAANPSDEAFAAACESWLEARAPWEKSEAFLFGPVDAMGLDPNMDSWPLDQTAIVNHINSGNFDDLHWGEGDSDDRVEAAQNIRGFHTLEFLLFSNGQPRKLTK